MYYLNLDHEGGLLSVSTTPMIDCPCVDSLDGYDFTGCRIGAYRWTGEALVLDETKLTELESAAASQRRAEREAAARANAVNEVQSALLTAQINSLSVDDDTALRWYSLYPEWAMGTEYAAGHKARHGDRLYKCRQGHTSQAGWEPENTPALWEEICESHKGTRDDPIPYHGGMALENGKYYTEEGILYRCTRDTGNPVYNPLAELVGNYVEAAE